MRMLSAVIVALLLAVPAQASKLSDAMLKVHNSERAAVGVPPLTWNMSLAREAGAWAATIEPLGKLQHSTNAQRPGEGENLWMGTAGAFSETEMAEGWAGEKRFYRYGPFGNGTEGGHVIGHYSQMIWKNTTEMGCAIAHGAKNDVLVCRYSPAGNVVGQKPY